MRKRVNYLEKKITQFREGLTKEPYKELLKVGWIGVILYKPKKKEEI